MEGKAYSVKEAAERLGCTEKTIRNRIRRGDLQAERVDIPGGFAYRVALPERAVPGVEEVVEPASLTIQALLGVIREKDAEISHLQEERAQLMGQASMFQERAQNLQKLLEAPKGRSWWQRLLGQGKGGSIGPPEPAASHSVASLGRFAANRPMVDDTGTKALRQEEAR